jgi:hypothetical protein
MNPLAGIMGGMPPMGESWFHFFSRIMDDNCNSEKLIIPAGMRQILA